MRWMIIHYNMQNRHKIRSINFFYDFLNIEFRKKESYQPENEH